MQGKIFFKKNSVSPNYIIECKGVSVFETSCSNMWCKCASVLRLPVETCAAKVLVF